jgi:hypothetical protein
MQPVPFSTADVAAPASNTAAQLSYAAVSDRRHALAGVAWSYDAAPASGELKIEDGSGNTVFRVKITAAGPGVFYFTPAKLGSLNTALIITLAAGGSGVTGMVSALGHWKE